MGEATRATALRIAFITAAANADAKAHATRRKTPRIAYAVLHAAKRGAGLVGRKSWWSVQR